MSDPTSSLVEFDEVEARGAVAQHCLREYFGELDRRFDGGFDAGLSLAPDVEGFRPPHGLFVVATLRAEPVGCGGLHFTTDGDADLKRMWVAPSARGLGLGRRLLADLEQRAAARGCRRVRLETNAALTEAIALYRSSGYREVGPFNDERYGDHWFVKHLARGSVGETR